MAGFSDFVNAVASHYGNKNAQFLAEGDRLTAGQKVRVFVRRPSSKDGEEIQEHEEIVDAKALGRKQDGKHVVQTMRNGRKWRIHAPSRQILVSW
jgi:hypothetical protein